jgi:hypothetical protein
MAIMVNAAFSDSGFLNAETPFEIVSIPVNAVQPEEKARRSRKSVKPSTAVFPSSIRADSSDPDCPVRI